MSLFTSNNDFVEALKAQNEQLRNYEPLQYEDSFFKKAIDEYKEFSIEQENKNKRHAQIALWCSIISTISAVITLLPLINKTIQYLISILS